MSLSERDIALIEKYIENSLSEEEAASVAQRMTEATFRDEVTFRTTVARSLETIYKDQLRKELHHRLISEREKDGVHRDLHVSYRRKKYIYWAASVAAVAVFSALFFLFRDKTSAESIFIASYKPYPVNPVTRGQSENSDIPAIERYRSGNYEEATTLLKQLIATENESFDETFLQLLLGNCFLNTSKPDSALICFKRVIDSHQEIMEQHGKWYYALALLKEERVDDALVTLHEIERSGSIYMLQARKLSDELNKLK